MWADNAVENMQRKKQFATDKLFAQNKFYKYLKTYPFLIEIGNFMKFGDMAHVQKHDAFHPSSSLMLENTLVLFTLK